MCDVPSIAVFCSESIECFPGAVSKFFFFFFFFFFFLLLLLLLLLFTAIGLLPGGSSYFTCKHEIGYY